MENNTPETINIALTQYFKNIDRVKKYNKEHPDKCRVRQKRNYDKMKIEHPEKYNDMLLKKKQYYLLKKTILKNI